jgi:hypothetical protein
LPEDPEAIVRQVNAAGLIRLGGRYRFIGKGLSGWKVGILPGAGKYWPVLFFEQIVGKVPGLAD